MLVVRGSIVSLNVEAIVNAANPSGLGCFTPGHNCIDNVIHRNAGSSLHDACKLIMASHKGPLSSYPITTGAFNLRASFVLHVAGPQVDKDSYPNALQQRLLSECYTNCLKVAMDMNFKTIAFPCISTGLYNFDNKLASKIAVDSVTDFIKKNTSFHTLVVFCVFTDLDEELYRNAAKSNGCP